LTAPSRDKDLLEPIKRKQGGGFDWTAEGAIQFGTFGAVDILAWTASLDTEYTFTNLPLSPRLGLKTDAISGDGNLHDNRLGTSNALFPKLPYFSEANIVAPANLLDVQPNLTLALTENLIASAAWESALETE
jgi:Alginate export